MTSLYCDSGQHKNRFKKIVAISLLFVFVACSRSQPPVTAVTNQTKPAIQSITLPWYIRHYGMKDPWQLQASLNKPDFGMYELTQYPDKQPTAEQQKNADELLVKTWKAVKAKGWLDKQQALKDGYQNMYKDQIHYYKDEFLYDGEVLNPERPEFLMYYPTEHGDLLMGVMFGSVERGPQIGGPLTLWHYHIEQGICYRNGHLPIGQVDENGQCAEGVPNDHSPEMLHLWFFNHPDGRFATRMRLTEEQFKFAEKEVWELYERQYLGKDDK